MAEAPAAARDATLAIIKDEHRSLASVLRALHRYVHEVQAGYIQCDFGLLSAMLYYIAVFPEQLHHPKEDRHLFSALRRRTSEVDAVLDRLQAEHVQSAQLTAYLEQTLVHFQGGAPDGLKTFGAAVDAYAALLEDHMRLEEDEVLAAAQKHLTAEDWQAIHDAFSDHSDPLFGEKPTQAFARLRKRIASLVPTKLKSAVRDAET